MYILVNYQEKPIYMTFRIVGLIGDLLMSHPIPLLIGDADLVKN